MYICVMRELLCATSSLDFLTGSFAAPRCHSNSDIPPFRYHGARYPRIICTPVPHILRICGPLSAPLLAQRQPMRG